MTSFSNDAKYVAELQRIEQLIASKHLAPATQGLDRLIKAQPHDPRLFLLGSCLARAGNNPDGEFKLVVQAHHLAPKWAPATIELAKVLVRVGQTDEALTMAEQAVQQATGPDEQVELLTQAAEVAYRLANREKSLVWLRMADERKPDDLRIRYKMAITLSATADFDGATEVLTQLISLHPGKPALLAARFAACLGGKQMALALSDAQALVALEPDNEIFQFYLAYARGENPSVIPAALMVQHFDEYAVAFDQHLVRGLHYTLPRDVAQMIRAWHPDNKVDVLDLGCGTGLLGACLGPMEGVLVGVELSTAMIREAHRHSVYHKFHQVDLVEALAATPENQYHVIAALDVLIYVGPLNSLVANALRVLAPGGRFVFSCETDPDGVDDFKLQRTLRYTHGPKYIRRVLKKAGFVDVNIEKRVIRHEVGAPVAGVLVTASKPS